MFKIINLLICFSLFFAACSFKNISGEEKSFPAKAQNFAQVSSVFKIELDEKLGEGSSLLLFIDYDNQASAYTIKVLGAFSSILLKVRYDLTSFDYIYKPQLLENSQVQELFEQTVAALLNGEYKDKYVCSSKECSLELGSQMFKNKYILSSYNQAGFAQDILCSYRRGVIKINLRLLKIK